MKRPLACTALVFVLVLFVFQTAKTTVLLDAPIVGDAEQSDALAGYGQGDTVVVCGKITDYSTGVKYEQTTTELSLKNIQILPLSRAFTKENSLSIYLSESDYKSQLQSIGNKRQSIIVYLQDEYEPVIGSYVIISGQMSYFNKATNPGEFDAHRFYSNRGVLFSVKKAAVLKVSTNGNQVLQGLKNFRLKQEAYLQEYLPDENDAIMKAMLFGNKKEMDEETKALYQKNGIAHILAISGLHISLLGMAVYKVLLHLPLPKWCLLFISGSFLVLYCLMVGVSASAFRALIMFSFFLLSKLLKRSYDMITAMAFSALIWLLLYPGYLFDCGFQLSYAAIMGIGIVLPVLTRITDSVKIRWVRKLISLFLPSLSVNLMTAPILIYHYYELSFFSIALNLIVIPLMAPLLLCGIGMLAIANMFGKISSIPPMLCAMPVNLILWIYEVGCRMLEWLPIGRRNIAPLSTGTLVMYYSILIVMTVLVNRKSHFYQFLFPLACICILIVPKNLDFSVWILDVGQGDCNVIFTEEGNCFVIDCGSTSKYNVGEKILIPFLKWNGIACVDGIIVTHPDADHMNGIVELIVLGEGENIEIKGLYIYERGMENEPKEWEELLNLAEEKEIGIYGIGQEDILQTKSFRMECLYPLREQEGLTGNAASLVMSVESGEFSGLFTGDLETEGERILHTEYKNIGHDGGFEFLKVAHHGSSTSTSNDFLQWADPKYAVISCGQNNIYGHPHEETMERLKRTEREIIVTSEAGAILIDEEAIKNKAGE